MFFDPHLYENGLKINDVIGTLVSSHETLMVYGNWTENLFV